LADSAVAITAGAGTNIDTRTEGTNSNHRQVVVLGDPATNAGVAPVDATAGLKVDLGTDNDVTVTSGTITTVSAVTTVSTVTNVATIGTSVTPGTAAANLGKAEDAAHASGDTGVMSLAVRTATAPTDRSAGATDGDYEPLQVDANGRLYVNAALYTAAGAAITSDTQGQHDTALGTISSVTGSMMFGRASTTTPAAVSAGDDASLPWYTLEGKQVVTTSPHTTGGLSTFMASGSDGSNILVATAQVIKATAGQLYGYYIYNPEAAVTFVHFYNTAAASVTVGTTSPLFTVAVPAGAAANLSLPFGITFSNAGWSCAATTTAGGNTAPATGASLVAWYL
jgi:hypothetical protein